MNKHTLSVAITFLFCTPISGGIPDGIYHKGWIDFNKNGKMDLYENPKAPLEDRVQDLLSQMTLEEKTCQMATLYGSGRVLKDALPQDNWKTEVWKDGIGNIDEEHNGLGAFKSEYSFPYAKHVDAKHTIQRWFVEKTRLGIPVDFTNEGIRGLCHDRATYFPAQCGQGATWNKKLIARIGEVEAKEAVALGYTNIYSPILDIAQDPRWGRCVETYGEDPYLVGELGKQMITSLQKYNLVATPKHFAVYMTKNGVPFRQAHAIAGKLVLHQIKQQQTLQDTDLATFQKFSPQIKADVYSALDQRTAVKRRNSYGGTGFAQVEQQIELAEQFMQKIK